MSNSNVTPPANNVTALDTRRARQERDPFSVDRAALRAEIIEWAAEVYPEASEDDRGGGLRVLVLRRVGQRRDSALLTCAVKEDTSPEALATRIANVAERYADSTAPGGQVAMEVCGFYGEEQIPRVTHHIGVRGREDEDEGDGGAVHGSRPMDFVRAMQNGAAAALHAAEKKDRRATDLLANALELSQARVAALESQVIQLFDANMKLADSATEREAKVIVARASADIRREAGKLAMGLAPAIVNRMAGQQILPEGMHPIMAQLSQLAMDIGEDEKLAESVFGALMQHGAKGQRLARTIGEMMSAVASINAAAEQTARIGREQAQGGPAPLPPAATTPGKLK